jgi:hypothetical protein
MEARLGRYRRIDPAQVVQDYDADEAGDTGLNVTFCELNLAGGHWIKAPRIPVVGPGILDTGVGDERVPALVTLESVKATLTPGGTNGTTGRLWLWLGNRL